MKRFRIYRTSQEVRDRAADIFLHATDFIYPYFVVEGKDVRQPIASMNGVYRLSIDNLLKDLEQTLSLGIDKILLFGVMDPAAKDDTGSAAFADRNLVSRAVEAIKRQFPQVTVCTDVCLCGYTNHGHCGVVHNHDVDNDATLPLLAETACRHALSGADFVAPSAMMDGQVEAIRQRLDREHLSTRILAYSAKYASAFYGPFRDAAHSAPAFGSRKTYQMDYRTLHQPMDEIAADIAEGADWIMVKPAMPYLDIVQRAAVRFPGHKLVAYQVSGEYSMLKLGAQAGLFDEEQAFREALTAIKRAGADYIISYYATHFVRHMLKTIDCI
jgi:porphobilinogen synthase